MSETIPRATPTDGELSFAVVNGKVHLAGAAPDCVQFAVAILEAADRQWLHLDGDDIVLTLANGTWRYRITERYPVESIVVAQLVAGPCCELRCTEAGHPDHPDSVCVLDVAGTA